MLFVVDRDFEGDASGFFSGCCVVVFELLGVLVTFLVCTVEGEEDCVTDSAFAGGVPAAESVAVSVEFVGVGEPFKVFQGDFVDSDLCHLGPLSALSAFLEYHRQMGKCNMSGLHVDKARKWGVRWGWRRMVLEGEVFMDRKELPEILSSPEVEEYLKVSRRTVARLIAEGRLKGAFKVTASPNSPWRVPRSSVEEFVRDQVEASSESDIG